MKTLCSGRVRGEENIQQILNESILPALRAGINANETRLEYPIVGGSDLRIMDRLIKLSLNDPDYAAATTSIINEAKTLEVAADYKQLGNHNPLRFFADEELKLANQGKLLGEWVFPVVIALAVHPKIASDWDAASKLGHVENREGLVAQTVRTERARRGLRSYSEFKALHAADLAGQHKNVGGASRRGAAEPPPA